MHLNALPSFSSFSAFYKLKFLLLFLFIPFIFLLNISLMDFNSSQSSGFLDLLNSQQPPINDNPTQFLSFLPSPELGGSGSRAEIGEDRKQRSKWSTAEDLVLISAWLHHLK